MTGIGRPDEIIDVDVVANATPACVALVPVTQPVRWLPKTPLSRPDPTFVTHLIATAEQAPQTRQLRRATPAYAESAYTANRQTRNAGFRTRRVIQA